MKWTLCGRYYSNEQQEVLVINEGEPGEKKMPYKTFDMKDILLEGLEAKDEEQALHIAKLCFQEFHGKLPNLICFGGYDAMNEFADSLEEEDE